MIIEDMAWASFLALMRFTLYLLSAIFVQTWLSVCIFMEMTGGDYKIVEHFLGRRAVSCFCTHDDGGKDCFGGV